MQEIRELNLPELREKMRELSEKPFRAEQIYSWLHERLCASFDEMSNLSLPLREKLKEHFRLFLPEPVKILSSSLDGTRKFIFRLEDGHIIESVFMRYRTEIPSAFPARWAAAWAAASAPLLWRDSPGI